MQNERSLRVFHSVYNARTTWGYDPLWFFDIVGWKLLFGDDTDKSRLLSSQRRVVTEQKLIIIFRQRRGLRFETVRIERCC